MDGVEYSACTLPSCGVQGIVSYPQILSGLMYYVDFLRLLYRSSMK
jgi:hypothetical protein